MYPLPGIENRDRGAILGSGEIQIFFDVIQLGLAILLLVFFFLVCFKPATEIGKLVLTLCCCDPDS